MTEQEQSLLDIYSRLSEHDAHSLLRFARFLAESDETTAEQKTELVKSDEDASDSIPQPEKIERPEQEKVVDALKRLSATYPMLDKKNLFDKVSELVAQHVMFGKPAKQVIDQIEDVFSTAYDKFVADARRA